MISSTLKVERERTPTRVSTSSIQMEAPPPVDDAEDIKEEGAKVSEEVEALDEEVETVAEEVVEDAEDIKEEGAKKFLKK